MITLEPTDAGWYSLFYCLATGSAGAIMLAQGWRRGLARRPWQVITLAWVVAGVVGALVPHLLLGDLVGAKTSIGAFAFSTLALAVFCRWLGVSMLAGFDSVAVAVPAGGAIVRVGCFLAGCCHGTPTSLAIGVKYSEDGPALHPVQLYEAIMYALLAMLVSRAESRVRRAGSTALMSVGGLATIRFAAEFVRDSERLGGLSLAQWITLPVAIVCLSALLIREARPAIETPSPARLATHPMLAGLVVVVSAGVGMRLLPPLEAAVLSLVTVAAFIVLMPRPAMAAPALPVLPVLLLQAPGIMRDTVYPRVYQSLGVGALGGNYVAEHRAPGATCDAPPSEQWKRDHHYYVGSLEYGYRTEVNPTRGSGVRVVGFGGPDGVSAAQVTAGTPPHPYPYTNWQGGVGVAFDWDAKWAGASIGGLAGQMYPKFHEESAIESKPVPFVLTTHLRVGPANGFSVEIHANDNQPAASPTPAAQFAVAWGDKNGNRIRYGGSDAGTFLSGSIVTKSGLEFMPFASGGEGSHYGLMVRHWWK